MSKDYSAEIPQRKALLDACIKAKKCLNVNQLWDACTELLAAKEALLAVQREERAQELERAERLKPDLKAFTQWMETASNKEYSGSALEFRQAEEEKGNGVFVKPGKYVRKSDVAMKVPLSTCLFTQFTEEESKEDGGILLPGYVRNHEIVRVLPSVELTIALLMEFNQGEQSRFAPYLAILPRKFDTIPLMWNKDELRLVANEVNLTLMLTRLRDVCMAYCHLSENNETRALLGTLEQFLWAVCVVNSRQNPLPSRKGRFNKVAMVPAFDMCNHDVKGSAIMTEFSWSSKSFECRAHKSFDGGEEFTIYYGARPDLELLVYSGFVGLPPGSNDNSALILPFSLKANETPDLAKVKRVLVDKTPGISPTGDENFYLLQVGGAMGEGALRMFARAAAAQTKEEVQEALKKKLEAPNAVLTKKEQEYVQGALDFHKKQYLQPATKTEGCRPAVVRVADELRQSNLAILDRILNKLVDK